MIKIYQTEFSRLIPIESIGNNNKNIFIEATRKECELLAIRFGLISLNSLSANLCLSLKKGGKIISLKGSFQANVFQTCVVTLENLSNRVEGSLDLLYNNNFKYSNGIEETVNIDENINIEEVLETLIEESIDIGEAVSEQLALEINFFPRKTGVSFVNFSTENTEKRDFKRLEEREATLKNSPFSVLADLKKLNKNKK
jgi:uncharacterized metal-binding protein YceD (DUF177 family)